MISKNMVFKIITIFTLVMTSIISFADDDNEGRKNFKARKAEMMKSLNLTEEQQKQMKEIRSGNDKSGMKNKRALIKKKMEEMDSAISGNASSEEIKSLHLEIQQLKNQKANARLDKMLKMREILTSEQRKKFHEMKKKRRGKRGRKNHDE